jgi:hypothetical protein
MTMWLMAVLASALVRAVTVLTWVCSSRRWLGTVDCEATLPTMSMKVPNIIEEGATTRLMVTAHLDCER